MTNSITYVSPEKGLPLIAKRQAEVEKRKKELRAMGAKSFEAVFVSGGKPRSDVNG